MDTVICSRIERGKTHSKLHVLRTVQLYKQAYNAVPYNPTRLLGTRLLTDQQLNRRVPGLPGSPLSPLNGSTVQAPECTQHKCTRGPEARDSKNTSTSKLMENMGSFIEAEFLEKFLSEESDEEPARDFSVRSRRLSRADADLEARTYVSAVGIL